MSALAERLDAITSRVGVRDKEVAELLGTTPQTVSRWRRDLVEPNPGHLRRILDLDFASEELAELYTPEEARLWLYSRHRLLGGRRAIEVIGSGDLDSVLRLIAQMKDGAFI